MSSESAPNSGHSSIELRGSGIPGGEIDFTAYRTRDRIAVARAFWPRKTAEHLAAAAGCSVRMAKFYLAGRDWSQAAVRAIASRII